MNERPWTYDFSTTAERLDDLHAEEEMQADERSEFDLLADARQIYVAGVPEGDSAAEKWYAESARLLNAYAAKHGEPPFDADYLDDEYDEYRELDWIERQERAA